MLHISQARAEDLLSMEPQQEQCIWFFSKMNVDIAAFMANAGQARTIRDENGVILACCGAIPVHAELAHAWTILSVHASPHMHGTIKAIRSLMESEVPYRRLEMNIRSDFDHGHRWARLLGYTPEGIMRSYSENGEDHHLYARVRT